MVVLALVSLALPSDSPPQPLLLNANHLPWLSDTCDERCSVHWESTDWSRKCSWWSCAKCSECRIGSPGVATLADAPATDSRFC